MLSDRNLFTRYGMLVNAKGKELMVGMSKSIEEMSTIIDNHKVM
jgi:hypothetical protein